jgi:hypothetical protein
MKQIVYVFTAMLLATSIAFAQDDAPDAPVLSITEDAYDFGTIKESEGAVSHTFIVKNEGKQPLVITRVIPSCGCTSPDWTKEPIAPGETGEVVITFNPSGRSGPFTKTVSVYSNGKKGSYVLVIKGEVI